MKTGGVFYALAYNNLHIIRIMFDKKCVYLQKRTEMLDFLQKYQHRGAFEGACQTYLRGLLRCQSRKAVVDLLLSAEGCPFIAQTIARGVVTADDLIKDLGMFEGGRYVFDNRYTSAFYINAAEMEINTTLVLLVDCKKAKVPAGRACEIHSVGDCKIECEGFANVYYYNSDGKCRIEKYGKL